MCAQHFSLNYEAERCLIPVTFIVLDLCEMRALV